MNDFILIASKFSKMIDYWNAKLDSFAGKYMDSPWIGTLVLGVLFVFAYWGIKSLSSK